MYICTECRLPILGALVILTDAYALDEEIEHEDTWHHHAACVTITSTSTEYKGDIEALIREVSAVGILDPANRPDDN